MSIMSACFFCFFCFVVHVSSRINTAYCIFCVWMTDGHLHECLQETEIERVKETRSRRKQCYLFKNSLDKWVSEV